MTSKGISVEWFKGMAEKEKEEFIVLLRNSVLLRRLKEMVLEMERSALSQETNQQDYDNPSWAYKQADRNGYRRSIKEVKELLTFVEI